LLTWGILGRIRVADAVQIVGPETGMSIESVQRLLQLDLVDRVTVNTHFVYAHNEVQRIRAIINGMSLFMLKSPTLAQTGQHASGNYTMLEDAVESSQETCTRLINYLNHADALPPDQLPLEAPLVFYGERMRMHQCGITGLFEYVKCLDDANRDVIPYGLDDEGAQIVDLAIMQPPVIPLIPPAPVNQPPVPGGALPVAPVPGNVQDPNAVLLQGVLAVIQMMMKVNMQSDSRNASMTQQQMRLQAAATRSNDQQLAHLTNHMGNLGTEVGKAIASHPTRHAIQATLSHPNAVPG